MIRAISNAMILQRETAGLVETIVLDDCYHMVTMDRQRGIVAERTVEFAQRLMQAIADKKVVKRATQEMKEKGAAE